MRRVLLFAVLALLQICKPYKHAINEQNKKELKGGEPIVLPIDMEIVMIVSNLPSKLSELSKVDANKAIELMQSWGDGEKDVKTIWNDANKHLSKHT